MLLFDTELQLSLGLLYSALPSCRPQLLSATTCGPWDLRPELDAAVPVLRACVMYIPACIRCVAPPSVLNGPAASTAARGTTVVGRPGLSLSG